VAGLAVIVLVPALAVAGVFGESWEQSAAESPNLSVRIEFPSRFRYKVLQSLTASITNRSAHAIDTIHVRLDSSYALRFSAVTLTPPAERVYEVALRHVAPGETRQVVIEVRGERYGRHAGRLRISSTSGDTLAIPVHSVVFP
jgi:hypothetical protein